MLGLAYKANIDDDRESPSYEIIELLQEAGARGRLLRPVLPGRQARRASTTSGCARSRSTPETFARYDAVVLSTAHDAFKDATLYRGVELVVDTRNVVATALGGTWSGRPRLVKA